MCPMRRDKQLTLRYPDLRAGDVVKVTSLPKYWGGDDIRGKMCLVLEKIEDSNYYYVLQDGVKFTISDLHMEVISESG